MSLAEVKFDESGNPYHGTDKNLVVEFFMYRELIMKAPASPPSDDPQNPTKEIKPVEAVTDEKGNFTYKETPFIRIITPGIRTNIFERPARLESDFTLPADTERFAYQWERFKKGEDQKANGHLLSLMGLGEKEIKHFNERNIYTVEHLISVPDGVLPEIILGARSIRDKAKVWLDNRLSENTRINEQEKRILDLEAKLAAVLESQQPKPSKKE